MDAAMDAGIGKGWMSGQGDGERCRDKATVLQGNGLGLHRWRWRRERTKGWMQASGRSVTRAESSSGESKVFWRTVWGLLSVWGHRGDRLHRWRWPAKATAHRGSVTWPWSEDAGRERTKASEAMAKATVLDCGLGLRSWTGDGEGNGRRQPTDEGNGAKATVLDCIGGRWRRQLRIAVA